MAWRFDVNDRYAVGAAYKGRQQTVQETLANIQQDFGWLPPKLKEGTVHNRGTMFDPVYLAQNWNKLNDNQKTAALLVYQTGLVDQGKRGTPSFAAWEYLKPRFNEARNLATKQGGGVYGKWGDEPTAWHRFLTDPITWGIAGAGGLSALGGAGAGGAATGAGAPAAATGAGWTANVPATLGGVGGATAAGAAIPAAAGAGGTWDLAGAAGYPALMGGGGGGAPTWTQNVPQGSPAGGGATGGGVGAGGTSDITQLLDYITKGGSTGNKWLDGILTAYSLYSGYKSGEKAEDYLGKLAGTAEWQQKLSEDMWKRSQPYLTGLEDWTKSTQPIYDTARNSAMALMTGGNLPAGMVSPQDIYKSFTTPWNIGAQDYANQMYGDITSDIARRGLGGSSLDYSNQAGMQNYLYKQRALGQAAGTQAKGNYWGQLFNTLMAPVSGRGQELGQYGSMLFQPAFSGAQAAGSTYGQLANTWGNQVGQNWGAGMDLLARQRNPYQYDWSKFWR